MMSLWVVPTNHRLLYTWIGHEIFGTDIRVVMGSNGIEISEV